MVGSLNRSGRSRELRNSIRFLLGQELRELQNFSPSLTVLEYLRGAERRCGTKEGCAEGDCGACTVVIGEIHDGRLRYRAVNSCIQFLPTLDGKQLITVEDLAGEDGRLHPVQKAMATSNGSQCGFCTPGFVMSLFAAWANGQQFSREALDDTFSGNLCRCTGYGPIIDAATSLAGRDRRDRFEVDLDATQRRLGELAGEECVSIEHQGMRFFGPRTIEAFAELLLEYPDATILAGGTDVGLWVTKQHRRLPVIISVLGVDELRTIQLQDDVLEFGAAVSLNEAASALLRHVPEVGGLLRRFASAQIRNSGTLCGNIANGSPIGDLPPALIALGAEIVLRKGMRRRVLPLQDYFLDYQKQDREPGEFVEATRFRLPPGNARFLVHKVSKRRDEDISAVCAAHYVEIERGKVVAVRLAYGGMAAIPKRAAEAERALLGQAWDEPAIRRAQRAMEEDFAPISDMRASAGYRMKVARNLLWRSYLETSGADNVQIPNEWRLAHE